MFQIYASSADINNAQLADHRIKSLKGQKDDAIYDLKQGGSKHFTTAGKKGMEKEDDSVENLPTD